VVGAYVEWHTRILPAYSDARHCAAGGWRMVPGRREVRRRVPEAVVAALPSV
jgi:hypothetical protein